MSLTKNQQQLEVSRMHFMVVETSVLFNFILHEQTFKSAILFLYLIEQLSDTISDTELNILRA